MTGPSEAAKEALGLRLRDIRQDAGLTGRALALACGWHFSKVSKLEHGTQTPSESDLTLWCRVCAADTELSDLIATVRAIEAMYVEWRRTLRFGMRHSQQARNALHEQSKLIRAYEPGIVPGIFQTSEYAGVILGRAVSVNRVPDDVDDAIAARLVRQRYLHSGDRRYAVLIEEQVLRTRVGNADVMRGQLERLLLAMSFPRVSLGVIPTTAERSIWPSVGFWIFDQSTVRVEIPSAELTIAQRSEIVVYEKRFELLQRAAVYGHAARVLVLRAAET